MPSFVQLASFIHLTLMCVAFVDGIKSCHYAKAYEKYFSLVVRLRLRASLSSAASSRLKCL
jgi:hypothetical protein